MGDTVDLPVSSRMTIHETPYWMLQALPDRIKYTLSETPPRSATMARSLVTGSSGYNNTIQISLETLGNDRLQAVKMDGTLFKAWLKYEGLARDSTDLAKDQAVKTALDEFHRLACAKSSYEKLPLAAAKVKFWFDPAKVQLPRITRMEHEAMK